ncbi:methyltransferase [Pseudonocardia sp. CA-142604]|uniref:methyltransferase n=1 Tax=Pseudonocardia sp. CA-142604 TaxID=3240024 RepID=UPI003D94C96E
MDDVEIRKLRGMAGLATPMALRVAVTLRLVDRLSIDGAAAADLAAQTETDRAAMARLLDHLVTVGVLDLTDDRYRTTALGDHLREDADNGLLDELDITSAIGRAELAFVELRHTVETGRAGYPERYGKDFWADAATTPALQRSFDAKMTRRFREHAPAIARRFDWSRFGTIVDVGGGQGTVLSAILREHPAVRGRLVDLALTAAQATKEFIAAGLDGRARAIAGSFFEPLPEGADAYILSDILHDWDDEHAHRILGRCAQAAGSDGVVLVIEPVRGHGADTAIDLSMLVFFGGRERSIEELSELAADHDLRLASTTPVADGRTLLEFASAT